MWKGVFPALTTKFKANDSLDFNLFEKNLNAQLNAGVDGVILGGSLGEAAPRCSGALRLDPDEPFGGFGE